MAQAPLEHLQKLIGYRFTDCELLLEALTHSSFAREARPPAQDNELLEFLGDAVLNYLVTGRLVEKFPDANEGKLSLARAGLVAAAHLAKVAGALGLGRYLRLGSSEERTGGREKTSLLVNALEALIAAIFRDGGIEAAQTFVEHFVIPQDLSIATGDFSVMNYKGTLQERLQAGGQSPARYRVVKESGAEHRKVFTVEVRMGGNVLAQGAGPTKKAAEQEAARAALELLNRRNDG